MVKSLFAGAAAIGLIASAAFAQEAYDSTYSRSTATQTYPVAPPPPPIASTSSTTVQTTTNPYTGATVERRVTTDATGAPVSIAPSPFDPTRVSTYREQKTVGPDGRTVEKSVTSETQTPAGTTTYSQTTTRTTD